MSGIVFTPLKAPDKVCQKITREFKSILFIFSFVKPTLGSFEVQEIKKYNGFMDCISLNPYCRIKDEHFPQLQHGGLL